MKDLKDLFEAELDLDEEVAGKTSYEVGQSVRFDLKAVQKANPSKVIPDDSGWIVGKSGDTYEVKIEANQEIVRVKGSQIQSFGDANDSGLQDTTGPVDDGQIP